MNDYFNLTIEEKKALAEKHDFTPPYFKKDVEETTTSTTTKLPE